MGLFNQCNVRANGAIQRVLMALALALGAWCSAASAGVAVSDGGQATYSQEIAVPPGIAGMAPKLSFSYVDGGINGPLGVGWSVQGISSISRCPASRAIDGVVRGVVFGPNDKLCLDGQRLIQTDAAGAPLALPSQTADAQGLAGSTVREYRTEKDIYARIRAYGTAGTDANNGPAYFKVWTKSGQVYEYGTNPNNNANALVNAQGKTAVAVWAVSRISDTVGNTIDFKYEQRDVAWGSGPTSGSPLPGHEWNISEIQYSGNKVVFSYIDRTANATPDAAEAYQMGSKNVSIRLLKSITTYINSPNVTALGPAAGAVAVKTYKLAHDNGPVTKRARVISLQECAGGVTSTTCLPLTSFNYAAGGNDAFVSNTAFKNSALATTTLQATAGNYGTIVGDFNGDGRSDFIRWSNTPSENRLYLSNGDGTFTEVPVGSGAGQFNLTDLTLAQGSASDWASDCYMALVVDFNGDGLADILRWAAPTTIGAYGSASCPGGLNSYLLRSNGDGSFTRSTFIDVSGVSFSLNRLNPQYSASSCTYNGANFLLGDFNGDGLIDIVTANYGSACWVASSPPTGPQFSAGSGLFIRLGRPDGTFSTAASINNPYMNFYAAFPTRFQKGTFDANGDSIADVGVFLSEFTGFGGYIFPSQVDASGAVSFTWIYGIPVCYATTRMQFVDLNGDGRADFICPQASVSNNTMWLSSGATGGYFANAPSTTAGKVSLNGAGQDLISSAAVPGANFAVGDFNGDGRADVLRVADASASNVLYLSNGDGTFTQSTTFTFDGTTTQLSKSDRTAEFIVGDFTGRGSVEILRLMNGAASATTDAGKNQLYAKADPTPPDALLAVTSPTGLVTRLTRTPLSNAGTRYASDRNDTTHKAVYPKADVSFPMQVVTTVESDTGIGNSTTRTEYAYRGLKASYGGRGMLGFREVRQQSPAPSGQPQTVVTRYVQDHPYTGVASLTQTYLGDLSLSSAQLLSQTTSSYCDKTSMASPAAIATPGAPPAVCATTALVQRPYLYQTLEQGWDLTTPWLELPRVLTTNSYNNSGDPLTITATTSGTALGISQTFTKATTNTYLADNTAGDNWILGRLQRATVQNTVPNSLPSITTATNAFPPPPPPPPPGPPPPPLNPAVLSVILQLLLQD